jgi:hypothetical protein
VEIRFVELGPGSTRVEIEHGGWDRLGPDRAGAWRAENQGGWDGVLPDYIAACAATADFTGAGQGGARAQPDARHLIRYGPKGID